MKFRQIDIAIYALYLALFKIYAVPQQLQQAYKILLIAYLLAYLCIYVEPRKLVNGSLPFGAAVILASILGAATGTVGFKSVLNGILYALCLFCMYTLMCHCRDLDYMDGAIACLLRITGVFCLISLVSIARLGRSSMGTEITYFFGNKFSTSYYFILFAGLIYVRYWEQIQGKLRWKLAFLALSAGVAALSFWLYCTTAALAAAVLVAGALLPRKLRRFFSQPAVLMIIVLVCGVIPFVINWILENKFVQYIIVDVLGENLVLTGRKRIYSMLAGVIGKRFLFGYGYGNNAVQLAVSFGNAQNGLLQFWVDYGAVGVVLFLGMIWRGTRASCGKDAYWGMYLLAYTMIVASIVEISYNFIFFLAVFFLQWAGEQPRTKAFPLRRVRIGEIS